MDLLWFVLAVGVILIGGLFIGLGLVWLIGKISDRRGDGDEEAGVTPGPAPDAVADSPAGQGASGEDGDGDR
jgi:hypothetical protein